MAAQASDPATFPCCSSFSSRSRAVVIGTTSWFASCTCIILSLIAPHALSTRCCSSCLVLQPSSWEACYVTISFQKMLYINKPKTKNTPRKEEKGNKKKKTNGEASSRILPLSKYATHTEISKLLGCIKDLQERRSTVLEESGQEDHRIPQKQQTKKKQEAADVQRRKTSMKLQSRPESREKAENAR